MTQGTASLAAASRLCTGGIRRLLKCFLEGARLALYQHTFKMFLHAGVHSNAASVWCVALLFTVLRSRAARQPGVSFWFVYTCGDHMAGRSLGSPTHPSGSFCRAGLVYIA
ncbi:hypothetical protein E2C01_018893 [Portunus trituberculatus]|uniref:Uncharacterized protein n=1 Tax=Portunus trituberculatus TaxID=210409 RepID=A0A5B7DW93_PORTR|nr:hypothetical protein [Portunus trituberculatus]